MQTMLGIIEARYGEALGDVVDSTKLGEIPLLLAKLVKRGSLPYVFFGKGGSAKP